MAKHEYKVGMKFVPTVTTQGYNKGMTYTVSAVHSGAKDHVMGADKDGNCPANWIQDCHFDLATTPKEVFETELADLEKKTATVKAKLAYIAGLPADAPYCPEEFRVYSALQALKGEGDDMAKAKVIAELIKGGK